MDSEQVSEVAAMSKHKKFMFISGKKRFIEVFQCSGEDMNLVLTNGLLPNPALATAAVPNGQIPNGLIPATGAAPAIPNGLPLPVPNGLTHNGLSNGLGVAGLPPSVSSALIGAGAGGLMTTPMAAPAAVAAAAPGMGALMQNKPLISPGNLVYLCSLYSNELYY